MKNLVLLFFFISFSAYGVEECVAQWDIFLQSVALEKPYIKLKNLCGDEFKAALQKILQAHHKKTGYREARQFMFSDLDNQQGEVCGVYTNECIYTDTIPNSTVMNCEHTWPKSRGAAKGMAKYDLHHLFPTKSDINSTRSNYPFCELKLQEQGRHESYLGKSSRSHRIRCFEPRDIHKGDVARAMFYFSVRYNMHIDSDQEYFLKKWSKEDLVSAKELARDAKIFTFQGNHNPFITYPQLVQFVEDF